jgi:hypothetical protein
MCLKHFQGIVVTVQFASWNSGDKRRLKRIIAESSFAGREWNHKLVKHLNVILLHFAGE